MYTEGHEGQQPRHSRNHKGRGVGGSACRRIGEPATTPERVTSDLFLGHATPDRAGARPYRVQCRVARCDMGPPFLGQSGDTYRITGGFWV
jgi:hypothetical protein